MKKLSMLLLALSLLVCLVGCDDGKDAGDNMPKAKVYEYEVVQKEDFSIATAIRYSWDVVVIDRIDVAGLKELSQQLVEEAKKENKFNAIVIGFYDYAEYVGQGYTLGKTEYAPDGEWGKAGEVKTGDYKKMDYKYSLMEKDWDLQLTQEEVDIYKAWKDLYIEKDIGEELPDEEEVSKEIAETHSITVEEVDEILMKQITWIFDNN